MLIYPKWRKDLAGVTVTPSPDIVHTILLDHYTNTWSLELNFKQVSTGAPSGLKRRYIFSICQFWHILLWECKFWNPRRSPEDQQTNRQIRAGFGTYKGIHPGEFCKTWIYGISSSGDFEEAKGNKWGFIWGYIKWDHVRDINQWGKHFKSKVNHG